MFAILEIVMKKKAVIVVGPHYSGKSKTIKKYFKPLVGIVETKRIFTLGGRSGCALSQSIEEKRTTNFNEFICKYLKYQYLVLAARPKDDPRSQLNELVELLHQNQFEIMVVEISLDQPEFFYKDKAKEILVGLS
jgi:hypothetical protein